MVRIVFWMAVVFAAVCFIIFVVSVWIAFKSADQKDAVKEAAAATKAAAARASTGGVPSVSDLTQLLQALAAAIQAITQAGPSLSSLAASIVFLGLAAWTAGGGSTPGTKCSIAKGTTLTIDTGKTADDIPVVCTPQSETR
jgi:hypothetical protein